MYWDIIEAKVLEPGRVHVKFLDGLEGTVKFVNYKGVFSKLKDPVEFSKLYINDYFITWPGELDLAPDALHEQISKSGECVIQ